MLRLIIGKAGTGKTAAVIAEIREAVEKGLGGQFLLVPEQYSHEAERELCARCGSPWSKTPARWTKRPNATRSSSCSPR